MSQTAFDMQKSSIWCQVIWIGLNLRVNEITYAVDVPWRGSPVVVLLSLLRSQLRVGPSHGKDVAFALRGAAEDSLSGLIASTSELSSL
jgi:hypothetical protein